MFFLGSFSIICALAFVLVVLGMSVMLLSSNMPHDLRQVALIFAAK